MQVAIDPEVFRTKRPPKIAIQAVSRLLETFDVGRHDWIIDPFEVDDFASFVPAHFPSLAATYASMARLASKRTAAWTGDEQREAVLVDNTSLVDLAADLACDPGPGARNLCLQRIAATRRGSSEAVVGGCMSQYARETDHARRYC